MAVVVPFCCSSGWVVDRRKCGFFGENCVTGLRSGVRFPNLRSGFVCRSGQENQRSGWARHGDHETKKLAIMEKSEQSNEELLLFFFQLDLTTRLQRALNDEQYDAAQQLREKIAEVEQEVARQSEAKLGSVFTKSKAQDADLTILRLRADLQRAIEGEDYAGAATIRDSMSKLESESLVASAKALVYQNLKYNYRLGQRIKHRNSGYLGVICGMDPSCCESSQWSETAGILQLPRGRNQPFYQVLVDVHQEPTVMVAYVAEDNIELPSEPLKRERFDHPYTYFLFYGMDGAGDFIPSKQLRQKYNVVRHELPWDEDDRSL